MKRRAPALVADDRAACLADERHEILAGLTAPAKRLSPKYFYDERGSELFDAICGLPEYYATRTEIGLLHDHGPEIAALVGPKADVVELGAGSSLKARLLLGCLELPARYIPVDISSDYLAKQAAAVSEAFPSVEVLPIFADFTRPFAVPAAPALTLVFFPGSTIGNFSRVQAAALLASLALRLRGASLLIGVDICKDPRVLRAAYNDSAGVTAAFNLNLLARLNRELGADFDLAAFRHEAVYDAAHARIEMRLVSERAQTVTVAGKPIVFHDGEHIVTEHSHKYDRAEFDELARSAGWAVERSWVDDRARFSVQFCRSR